MKNFRIPDSNLPDNDWWGISKENSLVILDRNISCNKSTGDGTLIFLRCSDWKHYEEDREKWKEPYYIYVEKFIKSLPTQDQSRFTELLKNKKRGSKKNKIYKTLAEKNEEIWKKEEFEKIKKLHAKFSKSNLKEPGKMKSRRVNHCYQCKRKVDNFVHYECAGCNWIICSLCGACGCGFERGYN